MYRTVSENEPLPAEIKALIKAFDEGALEPLIFPADPAPADRAAERMVFRDADHEARFEAVQQARADLRFDGLVWDDIMESVNQRFIDAGLDLDQYIDAVKALVAGDHSADRPTVDARLTGMRLVELHLRPV